MSIIYDFKAIKEATLAFPEDRPQNVVKPVDKPVEVESHVAYDYSDGAFPSDYSCWTAEDVDRFHREAGVSGY